MRQNLTDKEQINNPLGNLNDHLNQTQSGMPKTFGLSLKELGIIVLLIIVLFGYGVYQLIF